MKKTFLAADLHLGHAGICQFTNYDGSPVRPWDSVDDMDAALIDNWNSVVGPTDKVYVLGDVAMSHKHLPKLDQMNGDKVLIKGNHDIHKLSQFTKYFRDIRGYHVLDGCILSHIPIHKDSMARFGVNIHGHLHGNRVMKTVGIWPFKRKVIDPDYFSVCMEQIDYTPILLEDAFARIKAQGGQIGFRQGNGPTVD